MKNTKQFMMAALIILFAFAVHAQKYTEGDKELTFLKGEKVINLEYNYDNLKVGKKPEAEYKKEKIDDFNKKQPGKGERWAEKWVNNRAAVYEPMFEELLNKILFKAKTNVTAAKNQTTAKYTLIVHTTMIEPGFNAVVMKVDPSCNFEFSWIENATKKVMAKGEMNRVAGHVMFDNDWEFDPSNRIKECYAKAGKKIGKDLEDVLNSK